MKLKIKKGERNMKKWIKPELTSLDLRETAYNWTGKYHDGGYIGDGILSGHLTCDKPNNPS